MRILQDMLIPIIQTINNVLYIYTIIVVVSVVMSWLRPDPYNPIVRFIYSITEPVFYKIRKILPLRISMFDFTPIIVILLLTIIQNWLRSLLLYISHL